MTRSFPLNPDIRHLHFEAKSLLAACRAGDSDALAFVRAAHPLLAGGESSTASTVRLCEAQNAIARLYGANDWASLRVGVAAARRNVEDCTRAMADPRLDDPQFRAELAARKGLPPIGAVQTSHRGLRYRVVEYAAAVSPRSIDRVRSGRAPEHIEDLLPVIDFPDASPRPLLPF